MHAVQEKIEKKNQVPLAEGRSGELQAGRFQVARILKECGDPLAKRLLKFEDETPLKPTLRNNSVLIHGFFAGAPENPDSLRRLLRDLVQLAGDDHPNVVDEWLSIARTPAFTDSVPPVFGIPGADERRAPGSGEGEGYRSGSDREERR